MKPIINWFRNINEKRNLQNYWKYLKDKDLVESLDRDEIPYKPI